MSNDETTGDIKPRPFELVNVPTEHTRAIQTDDGKLLSVEEGIVEILNGLEEMKKLLG